MKTAHIITSPENLRYIVNYTGEGVALICDDGKYLFVDGRFTIQAGQECPDFEVITTNNYLKELKKMRFCKIYIEKDKFSLTEYKKFRRAIWWAIIRDCSAELSDMRLIKKDEEIACIARAAEIANSGFEHIKGFIKAGMSEKEVALELEFFMRKHGADGLSFDTIVASAERSAMAHAGVTDNLIPDNTYVLMDFGCKYKGYCSDMTRTIRIGEPPEELQKIYEIVKKAQSAGLNAVKAGVKASDIDKIVRDTIKEAGYEKQFTHSTGHGVGLDIHEEPRVSSKSEAILEAGMVITIEPGIYIENLGGIRIEDMVMVTEDGYRNFSINEK